MLPDWNWTVEWEWCVQSFPTRQTHLEISISLTARLPDISFLKTNQCWHFPHTSWPLALRLGSLWVKEDIFVFPYFTPTFLIFNILSWLVMVAELGKETPCCTALNPSLFKLCILKVVCMSMLASLYKAEKNETQLEKTDYKEREGRC